MKVQGFEYLIVYFHVIGYNNLRAYNIKNVFVFTKL